MPLSNYRKRQIAADKKYFRTSMDEVMAETGKPASGDCRFKIGQKLRITGPAHFPFRLDAVVVKATAMTPKDMAYSGTRIAVKSDAPIRERMTLWSWIDSPEFSIAISKAPGFSEEIDSVTVKEVK